MTPARQNEKPVIFSGPMVRALLSGTKTQTRRILKPQPPMDARFAGIHYSSQEPATWFFNTDRGGFKARQAYEEGDRLYVRESHIYVGGGDPGLLLYRATWRDDAAAHGCDNVPGDEPKGWRPSIHMPRAISRLTLAVTDVRVERLNDISEADAVAEGVAPLEDTGEYTTPAHRDGMMRLGNNAYDLFRALWNDIHGADAWAANPWVVAITFTVHRANIDALPPTIEPRPDAADDATGGGA